MTLLFLRIIFYHRNGEDGGARGGESGKDDKDDRSGGKMLTDDEVRVDQVQAQLDQLISTGSSMALNQGQ